MKVPVLVMAFNRPDFVQKTMVPICQYQPDRLYLACDGPRKEKVDDVELVKATQEVMLDAVDWKCEVKTLFRDGNLGCDPAVYEAISWFFEKEEYGVIIEDDVIVSPEFFKFCEILLPRYAQSTKVIEISAQNHSGRNDINDSYVYVQSMYNWGWATWRRAWVGLMPSVKSNIRLSISFLSKRLGCFRGLMFYHYFNSLESRISINSTWDTHWFKYILTVDGLVILPGVNLASNIGMNSGVHYGKGDKNPYENLQIRKIEWPLQYNDSLKIDKIQTKYDSRDFFHVRMIGLKKLIKRKFGLWKE